MRSAGSRAAQAARSGGVGARRGASIRAIAALRRAKAVLWRSRRSEARIAAPGGGSPPKPASATSTQGEMISASPWSPIVGSSRVAAITGKERATRSAAYR